MAFLVVRGEDRSCECVNVAHWEKKKIAVMKWRKITTKGHFQNVRSGDFIKEATT